VAWRPDGAILASGGEAVRLYRRADGATVSLSFFQVDDQAVGLLHTDDGLFEGDPQAFQLVFFRLGDDVRTADLLSADQLQEQFQRPNLGVDYLAGRPIAPPPQVRLGVGLPPMVQWASPLPDQIAQPSLQVRVRANDRGGGVSQIRVYLNGEPVTGGPDGGLDDKSRVASGVRETSFTLQLMPGDNVIEAEGYSVVGQVRSPRISAKVVRSP
jgi:hypothetical protein